MKLVASYMKMLVANYTKVHGPKSHIQTWKEYVTSKEDALFLGLIRFGYRLKSAEGVLERASKAGSEGCIEWVRELERESTTHKIMVWDYLENNQPKLMFLLVNSDTLIDIKLVDPNQDRVQELESKSKEELIEIILRKEGFPA